MEASQRASHRGMTITGVVLGLLVLYLLSPGPALKLMSTGTIDPEHPLAQSYLAPLIWLYMNIPVFQKFYDWYLSFFGP